MTVEDTQPTAIKISRLEDDIRAFDSTLERMQELVPDNMRVHDYIVQARDAIFRLQQAMRGCEIVEFAAPLTEPSDLFWNKDKQREYEEEEEEGMKSVEEEDES